MQLACALYLEQHTDMRFLYDYGFENAEQFVWPILENGDVMDGLA